MNRKCILLIVLLFIAIFTRIFNINQVQLFGDEIDVGNQANSILQTGKDYMGNFLPTYMQSFSESRAPLLMYVSVPFIKLFGLNEIGVRFSSFLFGIISIFLLFKLIHLITSNYYLSLLTAFLLIISPWHFQYSRIGFEITLLLTLVLAGTYFFYKFLNKNKLIYLCFSIIAYGLSFYTYNTANIFVPLLVGYLLITNRKLFFANRSLKFYLFCLSLTAILITPILINIFKGSASIRFQSLSIFNQPITTAKIIYKETDASTGHSNLEKLFHNIPIESFKLFSQNYLESISPIFLFFTGDQNWRHNLPEFGLIFLPLFFPLIYGLYTFKTYKPENKLMFYWLLISPLASSFTIDGGHHPTRLFLMLPPICYFIAIGLIKLKPFLIKLICFSTLIFIVFYSHEYFIHYPKESFEAYQAGYKQLFKSIPANSNRIIISNTPDGSLSRYIFYQNTDPKLTQSPDFNNKNQDNILADTSGFKLDSKTFFINNWHPNKINTIDKIYKITSPGDVIIIYPIDDKASILKLSTLPIPGFRIINTIYNPNNTIFGQIIIRE